jgi:hypothetical protein
MVGEYSAEMALDDPDDTFVLRFLYAFWRLCDQKLAVTEHSPVTQSAAAAAERAGHSPEVRVVRLRTLDQRGSGSRQVVWKHRWVVRMHRVRQWYPSEDRHKIIWRGPYVKGPEGAPLLDGDTVRALVR